MSVKIRLARRGRKKKAMYDIVVADSRAPRDGRFIEKIGTYNPNMNPASIHMDNDKAFDWVMKGAEPTDTVRAMLSYRGVMFRKHLQLGVIKKVMSQEEADIKLDAWLKEKEIKIQGKVVNLAQAQQEKKKKTFEAESKVKEARTEALRKKLQEAEAKLVNEIREAGAENDDDVQEEVEEVDKKEEKAEKKEEKAEKKEEKTEKKEEKAEKKEEKAEKKEVKAEKKEVKAEKKEVKAEKKEVKAEKKEVKTKEVVKQTKATDKKED